MPKQNIEAVNISAMTAEQRDAALALDVERLLRFGRKHKLIKELDAIVARNTLLDLLGLAQPMCPKRILRPPLPCWTRWWSLPPPRACLTAVCRSTASTLKPA